MALDLRKLQLAVCEYCSGTGWEPVGEKGVRLCRCRSEDRRNQTLAATHIPPRYENCTFESYKPRPATDEAGISQRRAINVIASAMGIDPHREARNRVGIELDQLSVRQASDLIDHLKAVSST